ncbi:aquaporin-8a.1 [Pimephales promelas]|uniref:aquaporin-8a.1 n=1 Tax=Pimephales promelas TaxID=90988 RepID=UPI001955DFD1|nr:aquaporin-8a.1 [Pimephales promelas]KAG1929247.1 AQuaPorin or aquaglyceroporin related [Pimephales promelas]
MTSAESKADLFTVATGDGGDNHQNTQKKSFFERYIQPCMAEVLGSTLFMFVGCVSVMGNVGISGSIQPALAHGLALAIAIAIFGEISGGHFNPAVSVCVYLIGGMELMLLVPYVLSQMLGGVIAAALAKAVTTDEAFGNATGAAFGAVQSSHGVGSATMAEMIMTLFLTIVVSMGAINGRTRSHLAPFCIGLTVTANILAGGGISGACMNPARAFGPAIVSGHWTYHWIYWVGPLTGALVTVSLVRLIMGDKKIRVIFK